MKTKNRPKQVSMGAVLLLGKADISHITVSGITYMKMMDKQISIYYPLNMWYNFTID